jgi:hypothetical protein
MCIGSVQHGRNAHIAAKADAFELAALDQLLPADSARPLSSWGSHL